MNPLKPILIAWLVISTALSYGQLSDNSEEAFSGYDKNWAPTTMKKAVYFTRHKKMNDTCWQWDTYNAYGPLIKSQQFIDENSASAHGRLVTYTAAGLIDSLCYYSNGLPHGNWYVTTDSGQVQQIYNRGVLVSTKKIIKKDPNQKEPTIKKDEKESEFPGGAVGWQRYLNKNLTYPKRAYKARIQGSVIINFIVDTTGNIGEHFLYQSLEYSLDEVALGIIHNSPQWTPAIQKGKLVKSYKRQPIVFGLQR